MADLKSHSGSWLIDQPTWDSPQCSWCAQFGVAKQLFAKPQAQLVPNTLEIDNAEKLLILTIRIGNNKTKWCFTAYSGGTDPQLWKLIHTLSLYILNLLCNIILFSFFIQKKKQTDKLWIVEPVAEFAKAIFFEKHISSVPTEGFGRLCEVGTQNPTTFNYP